MDIFRNQETARRTALGHADILYERLATQIQEFEKSLDSTHELGAMLASFGREVTIRVADIGYHNPYFIVFEGEDLETGDRVRLVQHVSQISVLFRAVPKLPDHVEPVRIGFRLRE